MSNLKSLKTMLYIGCFIGGTAIFLYMANSVKIPVYETRYGMVRLIDGEAFIEVEAEAKKGCDKEILDKIYYYINRDEWVECESIYNKEKAAFKINNIHNLKDKTRVMIDVEAGYMTLFEIIFIKGGNV